MAALHILIADDQIPPGEVSFEQFRKGLLAEHGDTPHNRAFADQCKFMGEIVQELRHFGYGVTAVRLYADAVRKISDERFDLAIIDLGWFMDPSLPRDKVEAAGWDLCKLLDENDARNGRRTPQIVFSSHFPDRPELSLRAAQERKLPLFKEATPTVRNSLMAAIGFVEATLAAERTDGASSAGQFDRELKNILLTSFKEPLNDYRRWALLTLVFVALSVLMLAAGVVLAATKTERLPMATLSSATSLVSGTISALLYKRLAASQKAMESGRKQVLKLIQTLAERP